MNYTICLPFEADFLELIGPAPKREGRRRGHRSVLYEFAASPLPFRGGVGGGVSRGGVQYADSHLKNYPQDSQYSYTNSRYQYSFNFARPLPAEKTNDTTFQINEKQTQAFIQT